jgi:hypothetical protein
MIEAAAVTILAPIISANNTSAVKVRRATVNAMNERV